MDYDSLEAIRSVLEGRDLEGGIGWAKAATYDGLSWNTIIAIESNIQMARGELNDALAICKRIRKTNGWDE